MPRLPRFASALFLFSLVAVPPVRGQQAPARRALIIAIDRYEYGGDTLALWKARFPKAIAGSANNRSTIHDLDGPLNDADAMESVMRSRFGFTQVTRLSNAEATRDGILSALEGLIAQSNRGDIVAFVYAGHGSQRVNSLANNLNKLDQTIVPADANAGQFDIRGKELAKLFDQLLDKGVQLTLIFDSCHSGAVTRGEVAPLKVRWAAADPRDAADASNPTPPEDRGALLFAAAQDYQTAAEVPHDAFDGKAHGVFTSALLRVLRTVPADEPAERIFKRVNALVRWDGRTQEPVARGFENDHRRPLFGAASGKGSAGVTVPVLRASADTVLLQAGSAVGLAKGTELTLLDAAPGAKVVRVRVDSVLGMGSSLGTMTEGDTALLHAGVLMTVDKWSSSDRPSLRVYIPDPVGPVVLTQARAAATALAQSFEIVSDPTTLPDDGRPLYVLKIGAKGWTLQDPKGAQLTVQPASPARVRAMIPADAKARLYIPLAPPTSLRRYLAVGKGTPNDAIALTTDLASADYFLAGKAEGTGVSYAWVRPNATDSSQRTSPIPARTDWIPASVDSLAGDSLTHLSLQLGRLVGWMTVEAPPSDEDAYPYTLALRDTVTKEIKDAGTTKDGDKYQLVLRRDPSLDAFMIKPRYVYVFAIDSWGNGVPLYPMAGNLGNRIPFDSAGATLAPAEIVLPRPKPITIRPPYGVDTFILVTSSEPLDVEAFRFRGVRTRGAESSGSPLQKLLKRVGGPTRGEGLGDVVPATWSIQRITLRSGPR